MPSTNTITDVVRFDASRHTPLAPEHPSLHALVVLYMFAQSLEHAIEDARDRLLHEGWIDVRLDYAERCTTAELMADSDNRRYVEEALRDGVAMVYLFYDNPPHS